MSSDASVLIVRDELHRQNLQQVDATSDSGGSSLSETMTAATSDPTFPRRSHSPSSTTTIQKSNAAAGAADTAISWDHVETETIRRVLLSVQKHEQERIQEGFNEVNFSVGVLNCILVAYIFGNYPEHFWLLWLVEATWLIPLKIYQDWNAKPLNRILYYVDYCWIMNFLMSAALLVLLLGFNIPHTIRKQMYLTVLGVCCGPLWGATATMPFVAVVFHDHKLMTSLFIHLTPPMLVYTFVWHADEIRAAWPNFLQLDAVSDSYHFYPPNGPFFWPGQGLGSVAGNATALYFLWFIPYTLWMLTWGLDLTRTNRKRRDRYGQPKTARYDTAFHSILSNNGICENLGRALWNRPVETSRQQAAHGEYEARDLFAVMIGHAASCWVVTNTIGYACCADKRVHALLLWLLVIVTVFRGSKRYVYWVTSVSSKTVQEEFAQILKDIKMS